MIGDEQICIKARNHMSYRNVPEKAQTDGRDKLLVNITFTEPVCAVSMGVLVSRLLSHLVGKKPVRILMVGLDAAGKTTILYKLKLGEVVTTIPTIGFNVETVEYRNISFTVWDLGGQTIIRPLWRHYYTNTQGVIFVVDSNDPERIKDACDELHTMLEEDHLRGVALLVLANKQDLPRAMPISDITKALGLSGISNPWFVQGSCATSGTGLMEGLDWLSDQVSKL